MPASVLNYRFGDFTLDVARGAVFKAGAEVKLRPKVYETLKYLVENPGRLISKKELIEAVWAGAFVTDDSIVQCAVELRRALGDADQALLKTVPRRGYLFAAKVSPGQPSPIPSLIAEPFTREREPFLQETTKAPPAVPVPRTSLVGREKEIQGASALLLRDDVRLLTLTGPGGAGKTRLALAVAAAAATHFPGGIRFVALASITDPLLVKAALAEAFGVRQIATRTTPQLIADQLRDSRLSLLLLDNFEQVLPAAALVAELVEACPALKIVATSRACLHVYGEQEFPVAPLAHAFAEELFVQRAKTVWPAFEVTSENRSPIQEICARLDGLPLAIELAAARIRMLPPAAIQERLQSRLQLLTGGALDLPERQQTLRSTIDWSHDLLSDSQRKLFRRLSVFIGGCTPEAAEAVCNTSADVGIDIFEGLASLVDQNLVQRADHGASEPRFTMLETIREYASERLKQSGEEPAVRRAHAAYCLVLAEEGNPDLSVAERARWLARCDSEIDNFRAALDWLFQILDLEWSLRLCVSLFRFWDMREHLTEGRTRLETVLSLAGEEHPKQRARISQFLGALTTAQGDFLAAEQFLEQGLILYERLEDQRGIAASYNALAISARDRGDYASAEKNFERSLACWRILPDRLALARCLHNLSYVVRAIGDYSRAIWALREAISIFDELGDRSGAAWSMSQQGDIAHEQGQLSAARGWYQQALEAFRQAGDRYGCARSLADLGAVDCEGGEIEAADRAYKAALETFADLGYRRGVARALEGCACLALAQGHSARALTLASAAAHLRSAICASPAHTGQSKLNESLLPAWQDLGEEAGNKAWAQGSNMTMEQAIQYFSQASKAAIPG